MDRNKKRINHVTQKLKEIRYLDFMQSKRRKGHDGVVSMSYMAYKDLINIENVYKGFVILVNGLPMSHLCMSREYPVTNFPKEVEEYSLASTSKDLE